MVFDVLARDKASKTFDAVGKSAERTSGKLGGVGKAGKVAALALGGAALTGISAFTAGLVGGFKEAVSYQKITDQLAQTIKATGGAAGVSVDGLKKYAGQLESMSGVDEELILSSENVLLTFTNVQNKVGKGNDVFNQASLAALNMSTTLGTDVNGAAIQVGKALNDPIKGITALSKAGVSFTAQQKDQIKALVGSGKTLDAQKIILKELNKEFGGAAAAAGKGFGGTIARLKDTVSDAFRDIATRALPTVTKLADGLAKYLPGAISVAAKGFGLLGRGLKLFAPLFQVVGQAISDFVTGIKGVGPATDGIFSAFRQIGLGIRAFIAAVKDGDVTSDGLVGKFEQVGAFVKTNLLPVFRSLVDFFQAHAKPILIGLAGAFGFMFAPITTVVVGLGILYAKSQTFRNIIGEVATFIQTRVVPAFVSIGTFIQTKVLPVLVKVGAFLVSTFTPTFKALGAFITGTVVPAFQGLVARIRENQPAFEKIGKVIGVVAVVIGFLAAKILGFLLPILVKLVGFLFRTLFGAIGVVIGIIGKFVAAIGGIVHAVATVIGFVRAHWPVILSILTGPFGAIVIYVARHFDQIVGTVKGIPKKINSAASGMWDGIKNAFKAAINWIIDAWNGLQFKLPSVDTHIPGVGKVGGFSLGTPDIPRLARGGIIPAFPGGRLVRLAEAGRPEAVIPLPRGLRNLEKPSAPAVAAPAAGGLHIHGDIVMTKAAADKDNGQTLVRGLRNLAFTMGV